MMVSRLPPQHRPQPAAKPAAKPPVDHRVTLVNELKVGPANQIAIPIDMVTSIRGILLDIDHQLFRPSTLIPNPQAAPKDFYERTLKTWLARHPVLRKAEVRNSGTGLHVILRPSPAIEIEDDRERDQWAKWVQVIQTALPTDPNQPGLNAMTRKSPSINSKNNAQVTILRKAEKTSAEELLGLKDEILDGPVTFLAQILAGKERFKCPLCEEKEFVAQGHVGKCYQCGKMNLPRFMSAIFINSKPQGGKKRAPK